MNPSRNVVVGLGNMGLPVARRLAMRGVDVIGVDVAEPRRTAFSVLSGHPTAARLDDLPWTDVKRVLLLVRTENQLRAALDDAIRLAEAAGCLDVPLFVVTTITPDFSRTFASILSSAVRIIECPITGGEAPALLGAQTAMIAGSYRADDIAFLTENLMGEVVVFDQFGEPALAKLLNNLLCAYNLAAFGTALTIAARYGLDPVRLRQVIMRGSGTSFSARAAVAEFVGDRLAQDVALAQEFIGLAPTVSLANIEAVVADIRNRLAAES